MNQRLRWDKSIIRFRLRKHRDVFLPNAKFSFSNFFSSLENITYNLVLNLKWWVYIFDLLLHFLNQLKFIAIFNILLYTTTNYLKFILFSLFRKRKNESVGYFLIYIPCMVFYFGIYLRLIRSVAYTQEFFFKKSYADPWNPQKSSVHAKEMGL